MFVIGTAGHVDHGKSTLVRALTGIDPDRLREEKERGMTIDLGFAWLRLPSGREVSIVDVPGHERFIKNMLAGVGGIDVALLVIAADESVMPQTEEHLAILDLLRVKNGVVALTKIDLVEPDWLELVQADVRERLGGTVLEGAPIVRVSAQTGAGLDELKRTLDALLDATPPKRDLGRPRLPVDRVFTVAGFGTVVTGTLIDGHMTIGQEVEILPRRLRSRVRGLQTHRQRVETARPGTRVAVNLVGVATEDVDRGDVVTAPRWLRPSRVFDARLRLLKASERPLAHNAPVSFHTGAAEALGRVRLLDRQELAPGETGWAQLRLERELAVAKGDMFIVRDTVTTVGGGEVVEVAPKRHRRFHGPTLRALETLAQGAPEDVVLEALGGRGLLDAEALAQRAGLATAAVREVLADLTARGVVVHLDGLYLSEPTWQQLRQQAQGAVAEFHRQFPLRSGMPREELKSRLGLGAKPFALLLKRLEHEGALLEEGATVRLPAHAVRFTLEQEAQIARLLERLLAQGYAPPSRQELEAEVGLDPAVTDALIEQGRLRRLTEEVVYPAAVYNEMVARVVERIRGQGRITVAEVRDMFQTSRKYALALMEHLDEERVTRRVGDERVLLRG
ncbi:MAG: selenocysteine-specific translation elongation factor [Chloroflexi bacterium]|nr:selenocysteine-specific translation elongation factor [Chloroflexota bacterium]MBI4505648.1 selenocysteine-specific translation elongation factor [Chloroflexota bacterium]